MTIYIRVHDSFASVITLLTLGTTGKQQRFASQPNSCLLLCLDIVCSFVPQLQCSSAFCCSAFAHHAVPVGIFGHILAIFLPCSI